MTIKKKESMEEPVIEAKCKPPKFKRDKSLSQNKRKHVPFPAGRYQIIGCRDVLTPSSPCPVKLPIPRTVKKGEKQSDELEAKASDQSMEGHQDTDQEPAEVTISDTSILARLYYPAADQSRGVKDQYLFWPNWLPHENYRQGYADFGEVSNKSMMNMINWLTGDSFIPCVPNVKPLRIQDPETDEPVKLPVIIFSHGIGSCRTTSSALCCELASNGYFVLAIEHRDGTACASFIAKNIDVPLHSEHNPDIALPTIEGLGPPSMSASLRRKQKLLQQVREQQEANRTTVKDVAGGQTRTIGQSKTSGGQSKTSGRQSMAGDQEDESPFKRNGFSRSSTRFSPVTTSYEWIKYQLIPETDEDYYEKRLSQVKVRAFDCSNALDVAIKLNKGIDVQNILDGLLDPREFKHLLDVDNAIIMGFSMGAASALYAAATDPRFKCILALDSWMYPIHREGLLISQPIIFINTEKFQQMNGNNLKRIAELINNCDAMDGGGAKNHVGGVSDQEGGVAKEGRVKVGREVIMIKGSVHYNQTDLPFIFPLLVKLIFGGSSKRNRFTAHDLTASLALVFMAQNLNLPHLLPPERERYIKKKIKRLKFGFPKKL